MVHLIVERPLTGAEQLMRARLQQARSSRGLRLCQTLPVLAELTELTELPELTEAAEDLQVGERVLALQQGLMLLLLLLLLLLNDKPCTHTLGGRA